MIKQKITIIVLITILSSFILFSCNSSISDKSTDNSKLSHSKENSISFDQNKVIISKEDTKTNEDKSIKQDDKDFSDSNKNSTDTNKSFNNNSTVVNRDFDELNLIFSRAKFGKVINSDFSAKKDTIIKVEEKLGYAKEQQYIAEAKGEYSSYPLNKLSFGFNKGCQIFEIRSFDDSFKTISLKTLKECFGEPDHLTVTKNEHIVGYKVNDEFKLLFVFKNGKDESKMMLDHYSVFYSDGTRNNMADDPGRQW